MTSSQSETEQNDVASDERLVSGCESDDDRTFIVGVSHDLKSYFKQ